MYKLSIDFKDEDEFKKFIDNQEKSEGYERVVNGLRSYVGKILTLGEKRFTSGQIDIVEDIYNKLIFLTIDNNLSNQQIDQNG